MRPWNKPAIYMSMVFETLKNIMMFIVIFLSYTKHFVTYIVKFLNSVWSTASYISSKYTTKCSMTHQTFSEYTSSCTEISIRETKNTQLNIIITARRRRRRRSWRGRGWERRRRCTVCRWTTSTYKTLIIIVNRAQNYTITQHKFCEQCNTLSQKFPKVTKTTKLCAIQHIQYIHTEQLFGRKPKKAT